VIVGQGVSNSLINTRIGNLG